MKNVKTLKVFKIVGEVLLSVVLVLVILVTASMLFTRDKYQVPNVFGYSFLHIITDSMEGENPDSISKHDLIVINRNVNKEGLEVGDVITFETVISGKPSLNTHRIIRVIESTNGNITYETQGDNTPAPDEVLVTPNDVIGVYQSKISGAGGFITYLQSPVGFFVLIVLPALLFLAFQLIQFIRNFLDYKLEKQGIANKVSEEELKAKVRAELLEEMKSKEKSEK